MIEIKYGYNDTVLPETFKFNGGEVQVSVPEHSYHKIPEQITVVARLHNSDDIMELLLVNNALLNMYGYGIERKLIIPYMPYSRQDRVMNEGEALSVKVFAGLINDMMFDKVSTWDAHSDVGVALIDNCNNWEPHHILDDFINYGEEGNIYYKLTNAGIILVSPDAGAEKKVFKVAQHYGGLKVINATKVRDTKTGKITSTKVHYEEQLLGKDLLIVDDICDGGMTFIKLAERLLDYNPASINLYVTHGIFSKGYQPLFDAGITRIFTTNSFEQDEEVQGLKVLDL